MKKLIAYVAIMAMCVMGFAACGNNEQTGDNKTSDLVAAKNYVNAMYKEGTVSTPTDYTVVGVVKIGGTEYPITWTADHESVKIVPGTDKMVTIDVDEANPEEVHYNLTATLTDAEGNKESVTFAHKVPAAIIIDAGMSYSEIVDLAYTIESGLTLEGTYRLCGTITKIDTPWSPDYKNITVTIKVDGNDKEIMCYRLKGDNAENLSVGDVITVEGSFKNYNGTIEFDAGCVLIGMGEQKDYSVILDAAYALEAGAAMTAPVTMTGVISKIDTPWSPDYKNITVTIVVNGDEARPIMCYRLVGDGADKLSVGDTITVTGTIKNYNGTIEFDAKCTADYIYSPGGDEPAIEMPTTPEGIVDAAYALESGKSLPEACTLTGVIVSVDTPFDPGYNNVTVTIAVAGKEDKPIQAFRLKGEGADTIAVGDTITVTGTILNYGGKIEFNSGCTLDAVVKGVEIDWAAQYVGDYSAQILPVTDFANCTNGFTLSFDLEKLAKKADGSDYTYWNFTFINNVDGWPKFLDAKYYTEKPAFSEWDFVDVSKTNYSYTFTADAVAEILKGNGFGIQVFGVVAHNIVITPVAGEEPVVTPAAETVKLYADEAVNENLQKTEVGFEHGAYDETHGYLSLRAAVDFENNGKLIFYVDTEVAGLYTLEIDYTAKTGSAKRMIGLSINGSEPEQIDLPTADGWPIEYLMTYKTMVKLNAGENTVVLCTPTEYDNTSIKCPNIYAIKYTLKKADETTETPVVEMTQEEIVNALYALEDGQSLEGEHTLTGVIDSFKYTYSPDFATIQLTIIVNGMTDKPVVCYKLGGEGIDVVEVGDTITVTGPLKNYKGTYEFNGCTLVSYEKGAAVEEPVATEAAVLNANDLTAATLTETTTFGAFTITATADASVTIDGNKKTSDSGIEFTQRIKLGGTGKIESRSVSFTTAGAATVTVYAMSSSGDTTRNLLLMAADGTVLATNPVYGTVDGNIIPVAVYEVAEAGTYYLGSEKSGINIYYIEVK